MSRCSLVYVDIGSNKGDSIEDFVSGKPEARVVRALDAAAPGWSKQDPANWLPHVCVYGFEANSRFTPLLEGIAKRVEPLLGGVHIYTETAVIGTQDSHVEFWISVKRDPTGVSSSVMAGSRRPTSGANVARVSAVNLVDWLRRICTRHHSGVPIVLRMDIEGAEYTVLQDVVVRGLAASLPTNHMYLGIEWHRYSKIRWPQLQLEGLSRLDARYEHLNHAVQWRLACLAEQHRSRGGRRLAGAVRLTGAQRMVTQCKEWFNATRLRHTRRRHEFVLQKMRGA